MALARQPSDLKTRVITCLNKLSDRDTLSIASSELESIAKSLSNDGFAPFLACLSTTDSSEKSPVRRQCVRLIAVLSTSHGDALSPHLSKLLSAVLRRLRDPDSAVRTACVEAVSAISSHITKPPFSSVLRPLLDCIFHEQDYNAQIGATLCLAAAVESAPEPDTSELKKVLPKLSKLAKNDCFKAKPALISLIGSIVSAGGASSKNALNILVPCIVEYLSSEDWTARKSAAESLVKVAMAERDLLVEHKASCIASLESRKFDKVKIVRETMSRALDLWKEIPEVLEGESSLELQSKSLSKDSCGDKHMSVSSRTSCDSGYETPQPKRTVAVSRSPTSSTSSMTSSQRRSTSKSDNGKSNVARPSNVESKNELKAEVNQPQETSSKVGSEDDRKSRNICKSDSAESESCFDSKPEAKRVLFLRPSGDKSRKYNNSRYTSRVVPFCEDENLQASVASGDNTATADYFGSQKEFEDISLIRKQLVQIETQQSNLMDLLQRFIGSSQSGMNSLEKRVNGLEKALDEMSHDLGIPTRRLSEDDTAGNTCCILPGAEFLSPKFWRKAEGPIGNTKYSFSNRHSSIKATDNSGINKEASTTLELHTNRRIDLKFPVSKSSQICNAGPALVSRMQQQTYATGPV